MQKAVLCSTIKFSVGISYEINQFEVIIIIIIIIIKY
jgi:hypothetical protein